MSITNVTAAQCVDSFASLVPDTRVGIFKYLKLKDILSCSEVSKEWNQVIQLDSSLSNYLWQLCFHRDFRSPSFFPDPGKNHFREAYKDSYLVHLNLIKHAHATLHTFIKHTTKGI